ncbi:DUF4263 domain-containing protein [Chitinibacter fontanus]|uniref:DUF4263 domain-containing protein n=1 Tax=Chitinibacter fontanus TaxID=1737446 RepID=A0A7D5ZJ40_9NEIS|nr:Shedu anti-phage system protein SduA domain-containing protein [Chitinibacter fontanus]QLI82687.1 DUF4263 domain-containing protein [Chitinibacter fontanus]
MTDLVIHTTIRPLVEAFLEKLVKIYLGPLHNYVSDNPELIKIAPGFLLNPQQLTVYISRSHIAVEYEGPEFIQELQENSTLDIKYYDYSNDDKNIFEKIIGFEYDSTLKTSMPLPAFSEDLLLPTNRGWDKLSELGWNFSAQNSIMGFNMPSPTPAAGRFTRIINGMFFDANESGLKTRRIKCLDFFPIRFDESDDQTDEIAFNLSFMENRVIHDAHYSYPAPDDYRYKQLPKINKFIEKWGNIESSEPEITSFLAKPENEFILTMKFGASKAYAELTCEWQSEELDAIRPDFFILHPNGYADIVEFKLPHILKNTIVGSNNREAFASWLNSYIAQTRVYAKYFEDPNNRKWFEEKYGFKVYKPRRWLVVGRRSDFNSEIWREIMFDYKDLEILTFDDLIDGVVVQFYK